MSEIDDIILDYLYEIGVNHEHAIAQPPKTIWHNLSNELEVIDRSPATVRRRMQQLDDQELVERREARGTYYRLSERGMRYVEGEVSREELLED